MSAPERKSGALRKQFLVQRKKREAREAEAKRPFYEAIATQLTGVMGPYAHLGQDDMYPECRWVANGKECGKRGIVSGTYASHWSKDWTKSDPSTLRVAYCDEHARFMHYDRHVFKPDDSNWR